MTGPAAPEPQCDCSLGNDQIAFHAGDCPRQGWCPVCRQTHDRDEWRSLGDLCGRCNQHTGNSNQGHYWSYCRVEADRVRIRGGGWKEAFRDFHFCCPGDCELEAAASAREGAERP